MNFGSGNLGPGMHCFDLIILPRTCCKLWVFARLSAALPTLSPTHSAVAGGGGGGGRRPAGAAAGQQHRAKQLGVCAVANRRRMSQHASDAAAAATRSRRGA